MADRIKQAEEWLLIPENNVGQERTHRLRDGEPFCGGGIIDPQCELCRLKHWRGWLIFAFVLLVLFYVLSHSFVFMSVGGALVGVFVVGVCVFIYTKFFGRSNP